MGICLCAYTCRAAIGYETFGRPQNKFLKFQKFKFDFATAWRVFLQTLSYSKLKYDTIRKYQMSACCLVFTHLDSFKALTIGL